MSSKFRFIAVSQDRIGLKKKLGAAIYLHEFLTDHQTDAAGWVNYGRPFGYAWICARWPGDWQEHPSARTLQRHMAKLKSLDLAEVHLEPFNSGMRVRLRRSVKFARPSAPPARQLSLLAPAVAMMKGGCAVEKPVEKLAKTCAAVAARTAKSGGPVPPELAAEDIKKEIKETIGAVARAHAVPSVEMSAEQIDARRRFLQDQAAMLMRWEKLKTAG